jgi:hypothetical protein
MVRSGSCLLLLLGACSAPDATGLYSPFGAAGNSSAGTSASGGNAGTSSAGAPGAGGAGASEGQGGSALNIAGTSGAAGSGGAVSPPDAGAGDAGDAAPDAALACSPAAERCDGLDNDCDGAVDPGATCAATCTGFALQGRGYMFCSEEVTRAQALSRCATQGEHLAWLETPAESDALRAQIVATGVTAPAGNLTLLTQIGGSDAMTEGAWFWVGNTATADGFQFWQGGAATADGQAVAGAYAGWATGEPSASQMNEDCAAVLVFDSAMRAAGEWDDRGCNEQLPFVCETP